MLAGACMCTRTLTYKEKQKCKKSNQRVLHHNEGIINTIL